MVISYSWFSHTLSWLIATRAHRCWLHNEGNKSTIKYNLGNALVAEINSRAAASWCMRLSSLFTHHRTSPHHIRAAKEHSSALHLHLHTHYRGREEPVFVLFVHRRPSAAAAAPLYEFFIRPSRINSIIVHAFNAKWRKRDYAEIVRETQVVSANPREDEGTKASRSGWMVSNCKLIKFRS